MASYFDLTIKENVADPALDKLKQDVDALVLDLQNKVVTSTKEIVTKAIEVTRRNQQATAPAAPTQAATTVRQPSPNANAKLPWFKYGIRGFLNKLWHGDSASNPNHPDYQPKEWTISDYLQLETLIEEAANNTIESILKEEDVDMDLTSDAQRGQLFQAFSDFRDKLMTLVSTALRSKAASAVQPASSAPAPEQNPAKQPETQPESPKAGHPGGPYKDEEPDKLLKTWLGDTEEKPEEKGVDPDTLKASRDWWEELRTLWWDKLSEDKKGTMTFGQYKKQIQKYLHADPRHKTSPYYLRIRREHYNRARDFMKNHGLDEENPKDVKKVWPRHADAPLKVETKTLEAPPPAKGVAPVEHKISDLAKDLLGEDATPSQKTQFFKFMLGS